MSNKKIIGTALATAAAFAFMTAPLTANAATTDVKCYGVNSCKGHSTCKTDKNTCKGQNKCKGQGVMMTDADNCAKLGGSTEEPKS